MAVQKIQKTQTTTLGIQTGKFSYIVNGSYDKEAFVNLKIPKEFLELRKIEVLNFFKTSTFVEKIKYIDFDNVLKQKTEIEYFFPFYF